MPTVRFGAGNESWMLNPLVRIRGGRPTLEDIDQAILELYAGGVVAYPTETFYGLGVNAQDARAVEKLFELKGRDKTRSVPALIPSRDSLVRWVTRVTRVAGRLMDAFWPGPLTLVFHARRGLPRLLLGADSSIGLRETNVGWVQAWVRRSDTLVTSTSANLSGHPPARRVEHVVRVFPGRIDLVLDAGPTHGRSPSTVVDVRGSSPTILREGAIPKTRILAAV